MFWGIHRSKGNAHIFSPLDNYRSFVLSNPHRISLSISSAEILSRELEIDVWRLFSFRVDFWRKSKGIFFPFSDRQREILFRIHLRFSFIAEMVIRHTWAIVGRGPHWARVYLSYSQRRVWGVLRSNEREWEEKSLLVFAGSLPPSKPPKVNTREEKWEKCFFSLSLSLSLSLSIVGHKIEHAFSMMSPWLKENERKPPNDDEGRRRNRDAGKQASRMDDHWFVGRE